MSIDTLQPIIHYSGHFLLPGLVAYIFFRKQWKTARLIMLVTMLVDIDHLRATPIFDPGRCSVGFHTFHSYTAIIIYILLLLIPNTKLRIVLIGLLLHMLIDGQDCLWMS